MTALLIITVLFVLGFLILLLLGIKIAGTVLIWILGIVAVLIIIGWIIYAIGKARGQAGSLTAVSV